MAISIIDIELTRTVIFVIDQFHSPLPWPNWLAILTHEPLIWLLGTKHPVTISIESVCFFILNNSIFHQKSHFCIWVVFWNMDSKSDFKCLQLVIKAKSLNFLAIYDLSLSILVHVLMTMVSCMFNPVVLVCGHTFEICDSIDTSLIPDQLFIGVHNYIFVLEVELVGDEWFSCYVVITRLTNHGQFTEILPHTKGGEISSDTKLFSIIKLDINAKCNSILCSMEMGLFMLK